ncbi:hypothetical protein BN1723_019440, partial [Verticillium longisporum]
WQRSRQSD